MNRMNSFGEIEEEDLKGQGNLPTEMEPNLSIKMTLIKHKTYMFTLRVLKVEIMITLDHK